MSIDPCTALWVHTRRFTHVERLAQPLSHAHTPHVQVGYLTQAFSYAPPVLAPPAFQTVGQTAGGTSVTLDGALFGASDGSARARVGSTACEATLYVADSALLCRAAAGAGDGQTAQVTVGTDALQGYNFTQTMCGPGHAPCPGPLSIPVGGHADASGWAAQGAGALDAFCYLAPAAGSALGAGSATANAPARALGNGTALQLRGSALGAADYTPRVRLGTTAALRTAWASDTALAQVAPTSGIVLDNLALALSLQLAEVAPRASVRADTRDQRVRDL